MYIAEWKKYTGEDKSIAEPLEFADFIDRLAYDMVHYDVILRNRQQHARRATAGGAAAAVPVVDEAINQRKPVSVCNLLLYRFKIILLNAIRIRCGRLIARRNSKITELSRTRDSNIKRFALPVVVTQHTLVKNAPMRPEMIGIHFACLFNRMEGHALKIIGNLKFRL